MPGRQEWDRPATMIAAVLGLVVLGGSLPFTVHYFPQQAAATTAGRYDVDWSTSPLGGAAATIADGTPTAKAVADVTGTIARVVVQVSPEACRDMYRSQLQQSPAQVTWSLDEAANGTSAHLGGGQFTCQGLGGFPRTFVNASAPDVRASTSGNATAVAAGVPQQHAVFTLTLSWSRPASPVSPVPVLQPTFSAQGSVDVLGFVPTVSPHQTEVTR